MNKSILITGTDFGLGLALVRESLKQDYTVYACLYKTAKDNESIQNLKKEYGDRLIVIENVDVGDDASVEKAIETLSQYTDKIDVLVNNAAINPDNFQSKLEDVDVKTALDVLNVNTLGALRVTKGLVHFIRRGYYKVIINISSEAGGLTHSYRVTGYDYCMSKAALNMLSTMLQTYLKPDGVKVLAVYPGWMQTRMGGSNAILTTEFAAQKVLALVPKFHEKYNAPIFMDNEGNPLEW